jgi:predicted  nucleic acid-binding Zn-ribbon protein
MLEKLSSLSRHDLEVLDTSRRVSLCKKRVEEVFSGERVLQAEVQTLKEKKGKLDLEVRHLERTMAELEDDVSVLKNKRDQATTQRILEAVDASLNKVGVALDKVEVDWVSVSETLEAVNSMLEKKDASLQEYRGRQEQVVEAANSELRNSQAHLLAMEEDRSSLLDGLEGRIIQVYERLRKKSRYGQVVFSLDSENCPSCSMQLARKLYQDVRYQGQVHACTECGVIVFWDS